VDVSQGRGLSGIDQIIKNPEEFAANRGGAKAMPAGAGAGAGGKFCGSCGTPLAGPAKFCGNCGKAL